MAAVLTLMRGTLGTPNRKAKFSHMFSNNRAVNILAAARMFLFASRDVWFVVGVPVYLQSATGLELLAGRLVPGGLGDRLWRRPGISPQPLRRRTAGEPTGRTATTLAFTLAAFPALIAVALSSLA